MKSGHACLPPCRFPLPRLPRPEPVFRKGAGGSLPWGAAHLVLTTAKQSRVRPLFWMMSLKFREAQELGLKNQAKTKYPDFMVVEPVL